MPKMPRCACCARVLIHTRSPKNRIPGPNDRSTENHQSRLDCSGLALIVTLCCCSTGSSEFVASAHGGSCVWKCSAARGWRLAAGVAAGSGGGATARLKVPCTISPRSETSETLSLSTCSLKKEYGTVMRGWDGVCDQMLVAK